MVRQELIEVRTRGRGTVNITEDVRFRVHASGLGDGLCHLFVQHTSASLLLCENADPDVRADLETLFKRLAPDGDPAYRHDLEGDDDMAAHARSLLSGYELTIPVSSNELRLGTWQGIFLWEHRTSGHLRRMVMTLMG